MVVGPFRVHCVDISLQDRLKNLRMYFVNNIKALITHVIVCMNDHEIMHSNVPCPWQPEFPSSYVGGGGSMGTTLHHQSHDLILLPTVRVSQLQVTS